MKGKALFLVFVAFFVMGCSDNEEKVAKVSVQMGFCRLWEMTGMNFIQPLICGISLNLIHKQV